MVATVRDRYTIAEAAELTGLSKGAIARRIERGRLPATKKGRLRYIAAADLAAAGLLNPSTGAAPQWAGRVESSAVAREIVQTVIRQSVELYELRQQLRALLEESRRDDVELRTEIERARAERRELRRTLEAARAEISELRNGPGE